MNKCNSFYIFVNLVLIFFVIHNLCYSQTIVDGDISSTTTWSLSGSPYNVTQDIYIKKEATLIIENGVTVNFQNRYLFVGFNKSAKLVADGVNFNNGTIIFNNESNGSILNSTFYKTRLNLEDFSYPNVKQNKFDSDSKITIHSPDAFIYVQNNNFTNGEIIFSFDVDFDLNLVYKENCIYTMDGDIFIYDDATFNIDKLTTLDLDFNSIYVGYYSDAQLIVSEANLYSGWIKCSDKSISNLTSSNLSIIFFELKDSAKLTIYNSNLDSNSTIINNSEISVQAVNNYWGRPEGPIMTDSIARLKGDVNFLPFSSVPLDPVSAIARSNIINDDYQLIQNYPNPFNPTTVISYQLLLNSEVSLDVYNLRGQKMSTLVNENQSPGKYSIEWNATGYASGIYFYVLRTSAGSVHSKKMILLK